VEEPVTEEDKELHAIRWPVRRMTAVVARHYRAQSEQAKANFCRTAEMLVAATRAGKLLETRRRP
jgi:hypothetical protein